jgi:hypothetical protein
MKGENTKTIEITNDSIYYILIITIFSFSIILLNQQLKTIKQLTILFINKQRNERACLFLQFLN